MHVAVLARLGLYALKTWLYAPVRVCMFHLEPIWACTPGKPGCKPLGDGYTSLFVPVWACTPK